MHLESGGPRGLDRHVFRQLAELQDQADGIAGSGYRQTSAGAMYAPGGGVESNEPRTAHVVHTLEIHQDRPKSAVVDGLDDRLQQVTGGGGTQPPPERQDQDISLNVPVDLQRPYRFHQVSLFVPL